MAVAVYAVVSGQRALRWDGKERKRGDVDVEGDVAHPSG